MNSEEAGDILQDSYKRVYFTETKDPSELLEDVNKANPRTLYFDEKFKRSRELLIFMEETKVWQELLQDCIDRAGVNAGFACRQLHEIVEERNKYYGSNFNAALRPTRTPGIPLHYEKYISKE